MLNIYKKTYFVSILEALIYVKNLICWVVFISIHKSIARQFDLIQYPDKYLIHLGMTEYSEF